jgi:pimeloyl-ACP methyl ester carboxylesterase
VRIILLPGMAGDARLFREVKVPGFAVETPDHVEPREGENLASYAERVAEVQRIDENAVIGGASFGGMLVAQIAAKRKVKALVLLSTTLAPRTLPLAYRALEAAGPLIPDALLSLRSWPALLELRLGPLTPPALAALREMSRAFPPSHIRRFGRMVMTWPGVEKPACPTLVVHGAADRMIPLYCAKPDVVLEDAGHVFTLTHPERAGEELARFLRQIC